MLKGWFVAEKKVWQNACTSLQVSIVGFGGTWISQLSVDEAKKVVRRAFELGINYFDTAKIDGDSVQKIGAALKDVRDACILATKTTSRTRGARAREHVGVHAFVFKVFSSFALGLCQTSRRP